MTTIDLDVKHEYFICKLDPDVSTNYSGSALPVPPDDLHELDLSWAPANGEIRVDDLCWTPGGEDYGESGTFSEDCSANKENIGRCYYDFAEKDFSMVRKRQRSVRVRRRWDSKNGGGLRRCSHCQTAETPQWRMGPMGPRTLCNACGVRYKTGRLVAEYRPAKSPSFDVLKHSNFHKRIMKKKRVDLPQINYWVS